MGGADQSVADGRAPIPADQPGPASEGNGLGIHQQVSSRFHPSFGETASSHWAPGVGGHRVAAFQRILNLSEQVAGVGRRLGELPVSRPTLVQFSCCQHFRREGIRQSQMPEEAGSQGSPVACLRFEGGPPEQRLTGGSEQCVSSKWGGLSIWGFEGGNRVRSAG